MSHVDLDRLVSVIIPTRNRPQLLARAIQSVINQTHRDIELLIVNDGGTDISDLIQSFHDPRIIYLQHKQSRGPSAARNSALKRAKGRYIAYLDDDDLYYPHHIATLFNALQGSVYHVAYSDGYYAANRWKNGSLITGKKSGYSYEMQWPDVLTDNRLPIDSLMHTRLCIDRVGLFDESLFCHEDWDLWIRFLKEFEFFHIPEATVEYTLSNHGQSISRWPGFFLNTMQIIHARYRDLAKQYPDLQQAQLKTRFQLWVRSFEQLKMMSQPGMKKLNPEKIMTQIVDGSLLLTKEDMERANILTGLLSHSIRKSPILWMLHAQLCSMLGYFPIAKIAITHAMELSQSPEKVNKAHLPFKREVNE
jgi:glycosyltransferase involved in cell wall biosynthesis